ncbi:MAG: hypothetical protein IJ468_12340 [Lachnospiraceae bacterium]|nr:hypothetical protein [Lachnospiraceae bacterium]
MGYKKAEEILPIEIVELIQQYVDGTSIYIPRKEENRQEWGASTTARQEVQERNQNICRDYQAGMRVEQLAKTYFLSPKSIQRIIREWGNK